VKHDLEIIIQVHHGKSMTEKLIAR